MFPDIPKLKADITAIHAQALRARLNYYLGFVAEVPRYFIFEGGPQVLVRDTGETEETKMSLASAQVEIRYDEVPYLTGAAIGLKIDKIAKEMAEQISKGFLETISEAVDRVGNVVDAKGQPLNPDIIMEMLEKIWLPFDEHGNPEFPSIVAGHSQIDAFKKAILDLQEDPIQRKSLDDLIQRKLEAWRDREAARRLVG